MVQPHQKVATDFLSFFQSLGQFRSQFQDN